MKIYTFTGDDGSTSLSGGRRVPKYSLRVEAYGTIDELIAWIGLIRVRTSDPERAETLLYIQDQLMRCAAALSYDISNNTGRKVIPEMNCTEIIEKAIDKMEGKLTPLKNFILPGGHEMATFCHIARCVCRRAERSVVELKATEGSPEIVNIILNRLSDYLFVLARLINLESGNEEVKWFV
jgi:cob(I)alamin adenosyltransferase